MTCQISFRSTIVCRLAGKHTARRAPCSVQHRLTMGVVWTLSTVFLFCIARSCMAAATPGTMGPKSPKIWVYSLVAVDYGGSRLLGHFLQHYGSLGIADDQFHFDMLHDPDEPEGGLQVPTSSAHPIKPRIPVIYQLYANTV